MQPWKLSRQTSENFRQSEFMSLSRVEVMKFNKVQFTLREEAGKLLHFGNLTQNGTETLS